MSIGKPDRKGASSTSLGRALAVSLLLSAVPGPCLAQDRVVAIQVQDGKARGANLTVPARGAPVLRLTQGEEVELQFSGDRATALHLHGYDIEARIAPDAPVAMRFTAHAAGRFALETHGAGGGHATLLYIEVHPK